MLPSTHADSQRNLGNSVLKAQGCGMPDRDDGNDWKGGVAFIAIFASFIITVNLDMENEMIQAALVFGLPVLIILWWMN